MPLTLRLLLLFPLALSAMHAATISTFAGTGAKGFAGDGGPASAALLSEPNGVARGPDGALYICDTGNHRIRKVTPEGVIVTVAGNGQRGWSGDGGPASEARLNSPYEVRFDPAGNVCWAERDSNTIRKLDVKTGLISTLAGTGRRGYSGDGGLATQAQLSEPHSLGFDAAGNLFICDVRNNRVRRVAVRTGIITTLVGNGRGEPTPDGAPLGPETPLFGPRALDFDRAGNIWLALRDGHAVYRLDLAAGTLHHVAGTGQRGFSGDGGPAKLATMDGPKGVSVDPRNGDVYIVDTENHAIRRIDLRTNRIELVAGTGKKGDGPEGDPLGCAMGRPHGVYVDRDGAIYIGDTDPNRVRVVR
jgi:DNA-binding beta-propeller fold protein YncE